MTDRKDIDPQFTEPISETKLSEAWVESEQDRMIVVYNEYDPND